MRRKVNYSQGDNLPLYATPQQSLQQQKLIDKKNKQQEEDEEMKKMRLKQELFLQKKQQQTREQLLSKMNAAGSSQRASTGTSSNNSRNTYSSSNTQKQSTNYRSSHQASQNHQPVPVSNQTLYKSQTTNKNDKYTIPGGLENSRQTSINSQGSIHYQPQQHQFSQTYHQPESNTQPNYYIAQDLSFTNMANSGVLGSTMNDQVTNSGYTRPPPPLNVSTAGYGYSQDGNFVSPMGSSPSSSSTLSNNIMMKNLSLNGRDPNSSMLSSGSNNYNELITEQLTYSNLHTGNSAGSHEANIYTQHGEDPKEVASKLFYKYDVTKSGRLTTNELQQVLQNDDHSKFQKSSIDSIINLFGVSRFNTLNLNEFVYMYQKLNKWRNVYIRHDTNGSHTLTTLEFTESVKSMGYKIPIEVVENLFEQFADLIGGSKCLKFDRFVESVIWLIRLTKVFRQFDVENNGVGVIEYKDFIDVVLYLGKFLPK